MTGGGESIFTLESLDVRFSSLWLIILIFFTIFFEFVLEKIEGYLIENNQDTILKMAHKLYKELMILGFLSFIILLVLSCVHDIPEHHVLLFEFIHFWIFIVAILFVADAIIFLVQARHFKKQWDKSWVTPIDEVIANYEAFHNQPQTCIKKMRLKFPALFGRDHTINTMELQLMKFYFLEHNNLEHSFDFAKYLRRSLSNFISDHLDAKGFTWVLLIVLLSLNLARSEITDYVRGTVDNVSTTTEVYFLILSWVLIAIGYGLLVQSRRVKDRLLRNIDVNTPDEAKAKLLSYQKKWKHKPTHFRPKSGWKARKKQIGHHKHHELTIIESTHHEPNKELEHAHARKSVRHLQTKAGIHGIFLWDSPALFSRTFDLLLLCQCFFMGLFILQGIRVAAEIYTPIEAIVYCIAVVAPQILLLYIVLPSTMKNYVFAVSIAATDKSRITAVEEWMEDTHALKFELRHAIRAAICKHGGFAENCADVKERVKVEFQRLLKIARKKRKKAQQQANQNANPNPRASKPVEDKECKVIKIKKTYLTPLDIRWLLIHEFGVPAPTNAQLTHLFRILDRDQSGKIDFDEFYTMLFDELDIAEHARKKREGEPMETLEAEFSFQRKFLWEDHNLYYWPSPVESLSQNQTLTAENRKLLLSGDELVRVEIKDEKTQLVLVGTKDTKILRGSPDTISKWHIMLDKFLTQREKRATADETAASESKEEDGGSPTVTMEPEGEKLTPKAGPSVSDLQSSSELNNNVELVTLHAGGSVAQDDLEVG